MICGVWFVCLFEYLMVMDTLQVRKLRQKLFWKDVYSNGKEFAIKEEILSF